MLPPNKTPAPSRSVAVLAVLAGLAVLLSCCVAPLRAQENAQLQIPPSLLECYNTSFFMNRDNRLPSTMETLISLIEKVENSPNFNLDIRQLAVALLHRFRQDGIQQASGVSATPGVLPYSPTGYQFPKFRILLSRLIPGNALTFPNSSLTREERCSMHFMLSSSIDSRVRGDESTVCSQLSQYRAQRLPRDVGNNFVGDVELLGEQARRDGQPRPAGQQQMWPPRTKTNGKAYADFDYWSESDYGTVDSSVSQCPVENGVVKTSWGTVAAGPLIAGIAAGLQPQLVQLRTLLAMSSRRGGSFNAPQTATVSVDNRWAATLSGDLAEVTLVQVPTSGQPSSATVGANGAWNSTVMPKWYFLSQRQDLEMTDAEIRGGLDGLILGMNVSTWRTQASSLKLSQLLRMYYSMDGVLGSGIMACNRKEQFATVAPLTEMIAQTSAFAQVLDGEMQLRVTLTPAAIAQFATLSANALTAYIPQYLNDVSCSVSNALPQDVSESITAMTDIYVFLDTSWQYYDVVNYVNYVIDGLNINPYASSVTLLAAADGSVIVNRTHYISDLYRHWNVTTHSWYTPGFNLPTVLRTIQNLTQSLMAEEKANSSLSGHSLVALLVPYTATVSDADSSYSTTALQYINEQVPDLRFVYYAGGTITRFSSFVQDPSQDLFALSIGTDVAAASGPVLRRIKKKDLEQNVSCPPKTDILEYSTPITDVYVFLDTRWPYRVVVDYLSYVLQGLNVHPYASSVTLLCASDGATMVNTTNHLSDVFERWNTTTHSWYRHGFSLPRILSTVRDLVEARVEDERRRFSMGGSSLVALLVPSPTATIGDGDFRYCMDFLAGLNRTMPDLHFVYYAGGAVVRFWDLVADPHQDLYLLSRELAVRQASEPVVRRIRAVPRRVTNPRCTASWATADWGSNHMVQYVRPGAIAFYRVAPNFFFGPGRHRWLNVQAVNPVTFTVCSSRSRPLPYRNGSQPAGGDQDCGQVVANTHSIDLSDACAGHATPLQCPPLYVSVQAQSFADASQVACADAECQAPDQAMFAIQVLNMDCSSGAAAAPPLSLPLSLLLLGSSLALLVSGLR